jgi:hypothetical protein
MNRPVVENRRAPESRYRGLWMVARAMCWAVVAWVAVGLVLLLMFAVWRFLQLALG